MDKFNTPLPRVVAHRGASADAPENTQAALKLAIDHGASAVEVDAMISSDGVVYLHHDDGLARCTSGTGYLCAAPSAHLDTLDASNGDSRFAGEPLPRLSDALKLLVEHNIGLNLEIKPTPGLERETAAAVVECLQPNWPEHLALVLSSFSREALAEAKTLWPEAPRALITCAVPARWHEDLAELECRNLHMAAPLIDASTASAIKSAGFGLYCFTVNEPDAAKALYELGVDGVFTDRPAALLDA